MSSLEEQILESGQKCDTKNLTKYIEKTDTAQLLELVQRSITTSKFPHICRFLLQGFDESQSSQEKRFKTVQEVIECLEEDDLESGHTKAILNVLQGELFKFQPKHLSAFVLMFLKSLQANKLPECWKQLLPEMVKVLCEKGKIPSDEAELSSAEYKSQIIDRMCSLHWSGSIVTPLTEMFTLIPLTKDERWKVCSTLTKYTEKMLPQEIPPFAFQMLKLCKNHTGRLLFHNLKYYFTLRVYDKYIEPDSDSEFDGITEQANPDAIHAESTVLHHIHTAAYLDAESESVGDFVTFVKNVTKMPEIILNPFNLSVLLAISTAEQHEDIIFEIVRPCISRFFHEEHPKMKSKWLSEVVNTKVNLEETFSKIVRLSAQERDILLQGLVNLSFALLGVGAGLGRDVIAEKQWHLGAFILFKIMKWKRQLAPVIIQKINEAISTGQSVIQYLECLYRLSRKLTLLLLENKSTLLVNFMSELPEMNNGKQALDVLVPLIKVSPTLRDEFIIFLRKSLSSRGLETQEVAVMGFLKLIANLKISNVSACTQSTFCGSFSSGYSFLTQLSLNKSTSQVQASRYSNEALCYECLLILRKCANKQSEVKTTLYKGLYDAVSVNDQLAIPISEFLWWYFQPYYEMDEEVLPPIKMQKICSIKDTNAVLQEPIPHMLFAMGMIVSIQTTSNQSEEAEKYVTTLDSLCTRMAQCELVHFELDDGTDLLDILPESQQKLLVLKQVMLIYEALIGYKMFSWKQKTSQNGQQIANLFEALKRFIDFSKNLARPKKAEARKKQAEKKSQDSQPPTQSSVAVKRSAKLKPFKAPDTLLNLPIIIKSLNLLHEPAVTFAIASQANLLKTQVEFNRYILQATIQVIADLKAVKVIDHDTSKNCYGHICDLSTILYERIVKRFAEFQNFDMECASLALEAFLACFNTICVKFHSNLKSYLSRVSGTDKSEPLTTLLNDFIETYMKLFEHDYEDVACDPGLKKMQLTIITTLASFIHQIPVASNTLCVNVMEWLKDFAMNNTIPNKLVAPVFIDLLFEVTVKYKFSLTLLDNISIKIGEVTGFLTQEDESHVANDDYKFITEGTVHCVLTSMTSSIKRLLDDVEVVVARLKCQTVIMALPNETSDRKKERLIETERNVCCQLCCLASLLTNLCNCSVPLGALSDAILKNLTAFYTCILNVTKYFLPRATKENPVFESCRFERLVRLCGKQLSPSVYRFMSLMEGKQHIEKKKDLDASKGKLLKETKLLPKLVYEIEQFRKAIIQLSRKSKEQLSMYLGQATVRDFRLGNLDMIEGRAEEEDEDGQTTQGTTMDTSRDEDEDGEEATPPPTKKSKH